MSSREAVISRMIEDGRKRYLVIKQYGWYLPAIKRACEEVFASASFTSSEAS
ncbi:hypothetical protein [Thermococcus zilligii]|uniref:hypothetical protein n=1 Tax=Thermococcus zilligii TaxID=54076 RepID=UPI00029B1812